MVLQFLDCKEGLLLMVSNMLYQICLLACRFIPLLCACFRLCTGTLRRGFPVSIC